MIMAALGVEKRRAKGGRRWEHLARSVSDLERGHAGSTDSGCSVALFGTQASNRISGCGGAEWY